MGFIGKVVAGVAAGVAVVTVLPLAAVGMGVAGTITAFGLATGVLTGTTAAIVDEIVKSEKKK